MTQSLQLSTSDDRNRKVGNGLVGQDVSSLQKWLEEPRQRSKIVKLTRRSELFPKALTTNEKKEIELSELSENQFSVTFKSKKFEPKKQYVPKDLTKHFVVKPT